MKKKIGIAIAIPTYNRFEPITNLLGSLENQVYRDFIVVIVDHGTQELALKTSYSFRVDVIKRSSNLWFTGAANEGILYVQNQIKCVSYLMLMNDDILIEDRNFLQTFSEHAEEGKVISCTAIDKDSKKIIYAGIKFRKLTCKYEQLYKDLPLNQIKDIQCDCDVLPTRSTLVPLSVIKRFGPLNEEKLPHYRSDYEWTSRFGKGGIRLIMLNSTYIATKIGDNNVSGRRLYKSNKLKNFVDDLLDRHRCQNIFDTYNYAKLAFGFPYNYYYIAYTLFRKILGFFVTNYIFRKNQIKVNSVLNIDNQ